MPVITERDVRFTRADYYRMYEAGVFGEEDRLELIDGQIRAMSPQNAPHARVVTLLSHALFRTCPDGYLVRVQLPLALSEEQEPDPDLAVVRAADLAGDDHPATAVLVVEVAASTLGYDRGEKLRLYARHGIPAYWIANLAEEVLEAYREPAGDAYAEKRTYRPGEAAPLPYVEAVLRVADLLR